MTPQLLVPWICVMSSDSLSSAALLLSTHAASQRKHDYCYLLSVTVISFLNIIQMLNFLSLRYMSEALVGCAGR